MCVCVCVFECVCVCVCVSVCERVCVEGVLCLSLGPLKDMDDGYV